MVISLGLFVICQVVLGRHLPQRRPWMGATAATPSPPLLGAKAATIALSQHTRDNTTSAPLPTRSNSYCTMVDDIPYTSHRHSARSSTRTVGTHRPQSPHTCCPCMAPTRPKNGERGVPREHQGCQMIPQCPLKCFKKSFKINENRCLQGENRSPVFLGSMLRVPGAETGVKHRFVGPP